MTLKGHSRLFLMFAFFHFFGSDGENNDFCVGRRASPMCQRYLEVRKTLNLTTVMKEMEGSRSCSRRCGSSRQGDLAFHYACFCDRLCGHYKDCCVDFDLWCRSSSVPVDTNLTCRSVHGHTRTGFLMTDSCPPTWKSKMTKQKCEDESTSEFLRILPVTDQMKNTLYKNIFCAICNGARNFKYWKVELPEKVVKDNKNQTFKEILAQTTSSNWKFTNHVNDTKHMKYCKPQYPGCNSDTSLAHMLRMSNSELQSVCNSYSFQLEVCAGLVQKMVLRNLHCALCDGTIYNITNYNCKNANGGLPSLTIAFDFVAHSSPSSDFDNKHSTQVVHYRCDADSAYDPFTDKCHSLDNEIITNNNTNVTGQAKKKVRLPFLNFTCMELSGNSTRNVSLLPNGSVVIGGRVRGDLKLEVIDNSSFICWNDTVSVAKTSRGHRVKVQKESKLGVITVVGFTLSSFCLLFLLFTYAIFPELRTTPGKCVMSLSCALLLYMACHVPITSSSYPVLCVGNAIIFHYSLLSVIGWLSVLAFDISKRFGSQAIERVAARAGSSQTTSRRRSDLLFFKYCAYSWGMPLVILSVCIALDITDTFRFAYGKGQYCYISTSRGIIAAVIAPVSAMLLFNLTALIKTIVGVHKLKKDTSIASNRSSQSSSAVLYLKLTCLFGLSWVLSIIFAFAPNKFVAYLTVSLNSCQGIFICLGFCFNKRVLTFYKTKLGIVPQSKHSPKSTERSHTSSISTRL